MARQVKVSKVKEQEHPNIERCFAPEVTQEEKDQIMDHVIDCPRCSLLYSRRMRIGACPSEKELRQAVVDPKVMERIAPHLDRCWICDMKAAVRFLEARKKRTKSRQ